MNDSADAGTCSTIIPTGVPTVTLAALLAERIARSDSTAARYGSASPAAGVMSGTGHGWRWTEV